MDKLRHVTVKPRFPHRKRLVAIAPQRLLANRNTVQENHERKLPAVVSLPLVGNGHLAPGREEKKLQAPLILGGRHCWPEENKMKRMLWHLGILLVTGVVVDAQSHQKPQRAASQTQVEEIYVGRSVSESRTAPTEFCAPAKTGLADPVAEGRFSLRSISINASDGRVLDTNVKTIGSGHGCFGPTVSGVR
jgi:hypothetical protein